MLRNVPFVGFGLSLNNLPSLQEQQLGDRDGGAEAVDVVLPCINISLLLGACRLRNGETLLVWALKLYLASVFPSAS